MSNTIIAASKLVMRRAKFADLAGIIALLADDEHGMTREDPTAPLNPKYLQAFETIDADSNQLIVIAEHDGDLVGCLQISFIQQISHLGALRGQIEGVRVARYCRGQGLGRTLIAWAIEQCRARRCDMVQLTSNKTRVEAIRFYTSLGFDASHEGLKLFL